MHEASKNLEGENKMKMPELFRASNLRTEEDWRWTLEDFGHIWFHVAGRHYFVFPQNGKHRYGLCYYEDGATGNFPRWIFNSETEFLNAKLFNGKSILESLDEVMCYEPDYPVVIDESPTSV